MTSHSPRLQCLVSRGTINFRSIRLYVADTYDHFILYHLVVIAGIAIRVAVAYVALPSAKQLEKLLKDQEMQVIAKLMGFPLTCVAVWKPNTILT